MATSEPLGNHPAALSLAQKIARIEWLAADNAADLHPSFVRICAAEMERRGKPADQCEAA